MRPRQRVELVSKIGSGSERVFMSEAGAELSFLHEETAGAVDRRTVGVDWPTAASGEATQGWPRACCSAEPQLFGRHSVDTANGLKQGRLVKIP